jgi:hypothetical protein
MIATTAEVGVVLAAGAGAGVLAASYYTRTDDQQVNSTVEQQASQSPPDPGRVDDPLTVHRDWEDDWDDHGACDEDDDHADGFLRPAPQGVAPPTGPGRGTAGAVGAIMTPGAFAGTGGPDLPHDLAGRADEPGFPPCSG